MNEIIPLHPNDGGIPAVNARDLHAFLEVGKHFGTWITERIEQFGFKEGRDFEVLPEIGKNPNGGRPTKEYALSLRMALHISMLDRGPKGEEARDYFIECERQLREGVKAPTTLIDALQLALDQQKALVAIRAELAEAAPKVEFYDLAMASDTVCLMSTAVKVAGLPFGSTTAFQRLRTDGILIPTAGLRWNTPYQTYIKQGLFTVKEQVRKDPETKETVVSFTTMVTQKGIEFLARKYGKKESLLV